VVAELVFSFFSSRRLFPKAMWKWTEYEVLFASFFSLFLTSIHVLNIMHVKRDTLISLQPVQWLERRYSLNDNVACQCALNLVQLFVI
jgi:hypothetical protein